MGINEWFTPSPGLRKYIDEKIAAAAGGGAETRYDLVAFADIPTNFQVLRGYAPIPLHVASGDQSPGKLYELTDFSVAVVDGTVISDVSFGTYDPNAGATADAGAPPVHISKVSVIVQSTDGTESLGVATPGDWIGADLAAGGDFQFVNATVYSDVLGGGAGSDLTISGGNIVSAAGGAFLVSILIDFVRTD